MKPNNTTHELKAQAQTFSDLSSGIRNFDIRVVDNHPFKEGDLILFREFIPVDESTEERPLVRPEPSYTGRELQLQINRIFLNIPGLQENHVVLGLRPIWRG